MQWSVPRRPKTTIAPNFGLAPQLFFDLKFVWHEGEKSSNERNVSNVGQDVGY